MRWLAILVVAGGCDRLLQLDKVSNVPPDGATPDGPPCTMPTAVFDTFQAASPLCGGWAIVDNMPAWMTRDSGRLVITPQPSTTGFVACVSTQQFHFDDEGVFVHASEFGLDTGYGVLEVFTYTNAGDVQASADTTFAFSGTQILLFDQTTCGTTCPAIANKAYVIGEMSWFRLRPTDGGASITAEYSANGLSWTLLGVRQLTGALAAYVRPSVGGGASSAAAPTPTAFDSFDVCPGQPGS